MTALGIILLLTMTGGILYWAFHRPRAVEVTNPDNLYQKLALDLVWKDLFSFNTWSATQEKVDRQLALIQKYRNQYAPTISDPLLRVEVEKWLDYYEREARNAVAKRAEDEEEMKAFQQREKERTAAVGELRNRLNPPIPDMRTPR